MNRRSFLKSVAGFIGAVICNQIPIASPSLPQQLTYKGIPIVFDEELARQQMLRYGTFMISNRARNGLITNIRIEDDPPHGDD